MIVSKIVKQAIPTWSMGWIHRTRCTVNSIVIMFERSMVVPYNHFTIDGAQDKTV